MTQAKSIQLPQGPIRYRELGSGEPIVFVHGFLADSRLWDGTATALAAEFRCILADWPMGSHPEPMAPDADLSPPGVARLIADFLAELGLEEVTIVGNDSGGAISQILVTNHPERIGRLVLTNCDSHDNFPPAPFNLMPPLARIPGAMSALALPFRLGPVRRAAYAPFAKRPIPDALTRSWVEPSARDAAIRRDMRKFTAGIHKRHTLAAAERLPAFDRPALLAWAPEDRFFKLSYAERLAEAMPHSRISKIDDAKTFVALDQPEKLAQVIGAFMRETAPATATA